jgi:hypothetical protein
MVFYWKIVDGKKYKNRLINQDTFLFEYLLFSAPLILMFRNKKKKKNHLWQ